MPKRGRPKKEKSDAVEEVKAPKKTVFAKKDVFSEPVEAPETDVEEMSDAEADAMIERVKKKKVEAVKKIERTVDVQEWTRQDPIIPESLKGRVWIAVFKCPVGHKTKATNRQATSGVKCFECKEPAVIMPQFMVKPAEEKRKKP